MIVCKGVLLKNVKLISLFNLSADIISSAQFHTASLLSFFRDSASISLVKRNLVNFSSSSSTGINSYAATLFDTLLRRMYVTNTLAITDKCVRLCMLVSCVNYDSDGRWKDIKHKFFWFSKAIYFDRTPTQQLPQSILSEKVYRIFKHIFWTPHGSWCFHTYKPPSKNWAEQHK